MGQLGPLWVVDVDMRSVVSWVSHSCLQAAAVEQLGAWCLWVRCAQTTGLHSASGLGQLCFMLKTNKKPSPFGGFGPSHKGLAVSVLK